MQATIAMLLTLGGMGCHHMGCAPACAPAPACYSSYSTYMPSSCYSVMPSSQTYGSSQGYASMQGYGSSCYSVASMPGCYSGYYNSGYYSSCYPSTPAPGCGMKRGCFGGGGLGLFAHCGRRNWCQPTPVCQLGMGTYDACYSMPVYGSYTPSVVVTSGQMGTAAVLGDGSTGTGSGPIQTTPAQPGAAAPAPPVAPAPGAPPANPTTPPPNPTAPGESAPAPAAGNAPATPPPPAPGEKPADAPKGF